ncbi:unnamed protein product [Caenorhabditis angaria]|uniref:F-box domain-containing protein n=1 Tax=Caenorhabditis angaria TaxID=860376 RepID=A0A9P1IIN6_9PELO|nr:unnamed protein product [Caenorhabditis angaria]
MARKRTRRFTRTPKKNKKELGPSRKKAKNDVENKEENRKMKVEKSKNGLKIDEDELSIILDVPIDVSDWIINLMTPDDRARFAQCAKVTNEAVQRSKNYIYSLSFCETVTDILIYISHQPKEIYSTNQIDNAYDTHYKFDKIGKKRFKYYTAGSTSDKDPLDDDVDSNEISCQLFKQLISKHQKSIRALSLKIYDNRHFDFGFENLCNLKELSLSGDFDISPIMSKIHQPLDNLYIKVNDHNWMNSNYLELILKTRITLKIPSYSLTDEQFLKLRARDLECMIGDLSEETIAEFVKSYKNGTINRNAGYYVWAFTNESTFDVRKLWALLGSVDPAVRLSKLLPIKHSTKRKIAYLNFENNVLKWRNMMG